MENKKLGFLIIGISVILAFIMFSYISKLNVQEQENNCNPTERCQQISSLFGLSHIAIGFLAFIFALGFYLLLFNKSEAKINDALETIQEEKTKRTDEDMFSLLLRPFDENERKVMVSIK